MQHLLQYCFSGKPINGYPSWHYFGHWAECAFTTKIKNLISLLVYSEIMVILYYLVKITNNNSLHITSKPVRQSKKQRNAGDHQKTHVRVTRLVSRPAISQRDSKQNWNDNVLYLFFEDGHSPTKVVLSALCDPHSSELSRLSAFKLLLPSEDRTTVLWQWQNKTSKCCSHIP